MAKVVKQAKKTARKIEALEGRAGPRATAKREQLQGRIAELAPQVQQRVNQRQAAGKPAATAMEALGQLAQAQGSPVPTFVAPGATVATPRPAAPAATPTRVAAPAATARPPAKPPVAQPAPTTPAAASIMPYLTAGVQQLAPQPQVQAAPAGAAPPSFVMPQPVGTVPPAAPATTAPQTMATAPNFAPPASAGPTFAGVLESQFGAGNPIQNVPSVGGAAANLAAGGPFQPLEMGRNPIETAETRAMNFLNQALARSGAQHAGLGLGVSSPAALARGAAIGEATANLGDILAQRGLQARESDLGRLLSATGLQTGLETGAIDRALSAFLGAGQLEQGQQGLQQNAVQQALAGLGSLAQLGGVLSGIGAQEQEIPGLPGLLQLLGLYGRQTQSSQIGQDTAAGIRGLV